MSIKISFQDYSLEPDVTEKYKEKLQPYISHIKNVLEKKDYQDLESTVCLPFDNSDFEAVKEVTKNIDRSKIKYILNIAIGGSSLGTQAVYESLKVKNTPIILFADTVSQKTINDIIEAIANIKDLNELVINVVSKSGSTLETKENFTLLEKYLVEKFGDISKNIFICSEENSLLWNYSLKNNYSILKMRPLVGGRYSIFSPAGLTSLYLAGFSIEDILIGARESFNNLDFIIESACRVFYYHNKGSAILNNFFFNPSLEYLGKWQRQLTAESLGKDGKGILPIVSIGTNDLHSTTQMYLSGPKNIYTNFIYSKEEGTLSRIMSALYAGAVGAYREKKLPFTEFYFDKIDEYHLGFYIQYNMVETMLLGNLLGINAFDQPAVEIYKKLARKILAS